MNDIPVNRAAIVQLAEDEAVTGGLTILDRDWSSGGSQLELIAEASGGVLVAIDVAVPGEGEEQRDIFDIDEERCGTLMAAARAWNEQHGSRYRRFRVDVARFMPVDPGSSYRYIEYAEGVA